MAFLDSTLLLDLQEKGGLDEGRYPELGLVDAVKASTPATDLFLGSQGREALGKMSSLRDYQLPYIKDMDVVVNTTAGFTQIPTNMEESAQLSFVAVDLFSGMRHIESAYENNAIGKQEAFQIKMKKILHAMGTAKESLIATALEVIKTQALAYGTQVSQGDGVFSFNAGTDTLEINKAAQGDMMFSNLQSLMNANDLAGNYRIITNRAGLAFPRSQNAKYSLYNTKNLTGLGVFSESNMHESNSVAAGSDVFNGWFLRDGAIGMISNWPYDFRNGTVVGGKKWSISPTELPFIKSRPSIYINNEATDATALMSTGTDSNLIMTSFEEIAIWDRFYIVYPPNSTRSTKAGDVVKVKGLIT